MNNTNISQSLEFLKHFLDGQKLGLQWFNEREGANGVPGNCFITQESELPEAIENLEARNKEGCGIYFAPSAFKFNAPNLTAPWVDYPRSLFVDFDLKLKPEISQALIDKGPEALGLKSIQSAPVFSQLFLNCLGFFKYKPHFIINTSPNKFQVHWLLDSEATKVNPDICIKAFKGALSYFSTLFFSDHAVTNENRVMRLPGFLHQKETPFLTSEITPQARALLCQKDLEVRYDLEELINEALAVLDTRPGPFSTMFDAALWQDKQSRSLGLVPEGRIVSDDGKIIVYKGPRLSDIESNDSLRVPIGSRHSFFTAAIPRLFHKLSAQGLEDSKLVTAVTAKVLEINTSKLEKPFKGREVNELTRIIKWSHARWKSEATLAIEGEEEKKRLLAQVQAFNMPAPQAPLAPNQTSEIETTKTGVAIETIETIDTTDAHQKQTPKSKILGKKVARTHLNFNNPMLLGELFLGTCLTGYPITIRKIDTAIFYGKIVQDSMNWELVTPGITDLHGLCMAWCEMTALHGTQYFECEVKKKNGATEIENKLVTSTHISNFENIVMRKLKDMIDNKFSLDNQPWWKNNKTCLAHNGWFDATTGQFHEDIDFWAKCPYASACSYNPNAKIDNWLNVLDTWFGDKDNETKTKRIKMLQLWMGYLLTRGNYAQKFMVIWGPGGTGKTALLQVIERILAKSNSNSSFSPTIFTNITAMTSNFGMANLHTAQLIVLNEATSKTPRKDLVAVSALIKSISGQDRVRIEQKYLSAFQRPIDAKVMVVGNSLPSFPNDGGAISRRLLIIPMTRKLLEGEQGESIADKNKNWEQTIEPELDGIFTWACQGARDLSTASHPATAFEPFKDKGSTDMGSDYTSEGNPIESIMNRLYEVKRDGDTDKWQAISVAKVAEEVRQELELAGQPMFEWPLHTIRVEISMWCEAHGVVKNNLRYEDSSQKKVYTNLRRKSTDLPPPSSFNQTEF